MRHNHLEPVPSGISGDTGETVEHPETTHPVHTARIDEPPSTRSIEVDPVKLFQDALHGYN
jgi:hypothetical protein